MKTGLRFTASILVFACVAGCTGAGQKQVRSPAENTVEIAVAGPMSGELAVFGEQLRRGAEAAVDAINEAGGVNGKKLHLTIADDQCDRKKAVRAASNLVGEGVVFVAGHFCSGSSIPASKIYGSEGILQITPSSTNPMLTDEAVSDGVNTVLRTSGRDDRQGSTAVDWLVRRHAGEAVAILDDGSAYGREILAIIKQELPQEKFASVDFVSFSSGQKNFNAEASGFAAKGVKAAYVAGYHDEVAPFAKAMRAAGSDAEIAAPDALNTSEFWSLAGSAGEGVRYSDAPYLVDSASAANVVKTFRSDGYEPEGYTLSTYAAVQAFAAAAKGTASFDGRKMGDWLRHNTVPTVIGDLTWDAKGDLTKISYVWYVWHDGRAVVEPLD